MKRIRIELLKKKILSNILVLIYCLIQFESFSQSPINYYPQNHFFFKEKEKKGRKPSLENHSNIWPLVLNKNQSDSLNKNQTINLKESSKSSLTFIPNGEFYAGYDAAHGTKEHLSFWTYLAPSLKLSVKYKA